MRFWKLAALLVAVFGLALVPMACGDDNDGGEGEAEGEPAPDTGGAGEPTANEPTPEPPPDTCPSANEAGVLPDGHPDGCL